MFSYCENNPVNQSDYSGMLPIQAIACIVGGLVNVVSSAATSAFEGEKYSAFDALMDFGEGAIGAVRNSWFGVFAAGFAGLHSGISAYRNGATLASAVACGIISAGFSYISASTFLSNFELTKGFIAITGIFDTYAGCAVNMIEDSINNSITNNHCRKYEPSQQELTKWANMTEHYRQQVIS